MKNYGQEISIAGALVLLCGILVLAAPGFFSRENLADLLLANLPVLIIGLGMTLVILTAEIDVSVGSMFAICGVIAGEVAKASGSILLAVVAAIVAGAVLGAANGALVAYVRIPSIVVTLATMTAWRSGLRWTMQGQWVDNLPANFQWLGLPQTGFRVAALAITLGLVAFTAWGLWSWRAGRALYATGSNREAARVAGLNTPAIIASVFVLTGVLTGLAAALDAARFNQVPSNAGIGLELTVIAAVVVGGTSITGGRGSVAGTVLGVALLGVIAPALIFLGVSGYWGDAVQGAIILIAIGLEAVRLHSARRKMEGAGVAVVAA
jgi:rhamnose transport system permease protein